MDAVLSSYGLAGLVISVLAGVVIFLYRDGKNLQKRFDDLQEKRLAEAIETRDKIIVPLENLTKITERTLDVLLNTDKRGA